MDSKLRPQPIGIFPFPATYLLLPNGDDSEELHATLMKGKIEGVENDNHFFMKALGGDLEGALSDLSSMEGIESDFNRFILEPSKEQYEELKTRLGGNELALLEVAAFSMNLIESPPKAEDCDGEFLALVLLTTATYEIEKNPGTDIFDILKNAFDAAKDSPLFAAQIQGNIAEQIHQKKGACPDALHQYRLAADTLEQSDLFHLTASLYLNMGICYQEMAAGRREVFMEAVKCYQNALQVFKAETFPEQFALAQNNLALSYLSMPMTEASDQLRVGIAVQGLREVIKVWTKESNPSGWASAQLNLANALQYLPSKHQEENLVEAVELYEEVLEVRNEESDPIGYARLLANQGNALAHLGIFEHAVEKLTSAKALFENNGDKDSADSVNEVLSEIDHSKKKSEAATAND